MLLNYLKKIFFITLLLANIKVHAQQDAQFSQYMFNTLFFNPAFSGVEGVTKFTIIHRTQWAGYNASFDNGGSPVTQILSASTPLLRMNSGVGLYVVNDKLGPLTNLEAQASYAYHFPVASGKLSIGVRGGIYSQTINFDLYRAVDANDPILQQGKESQVRPDVAFGVYYRGEKFYGGISANHLIRSQFNFGIDNLKNPLQQNIYATAGYDYALNDLLTITPSILLKSDFNTYSFEASGLVTYNQLLWGGLSFRQGDSFIALAGFNLTKNKNLRVGYSFDYVYSGKAAKRPTSHEILLSYALPVPTPKIKPMIRTPRFKHD